LHWSKDAKCSTRQTENDVVVVVGVAVVVFVPDG
jgi:hypothetical protein